MTIDTKSNNDIETAIFESVDESDALQAEHQVSSSMDDPVFHGHPDDGMFLGRWILVDSKMSAPFLNLTTSEMVVTRQVNEKTGKVEYLTKTSVKIRFCCCFWWRVSSTSISTLTSKETFTVIPSRTSLVDGCVDYGRREGDNKFITVGKKGTNEIEYRGDRCYMKNVDARYSLISTMEYQRVETFSSGGRRGGGY